MARFRLAAAVILGWVVLTAHAQTSPSALPTQPSWQQLSARQKTVLAPLASDWNGFSDLHKLKWIGIADRYATMSPVEQTRMQERMRDWSALTPAERDNARTQYKRLLTAPPAERKTLEQKWQEYDALSKEEKQRLKTNPPAASAPAVTPQVRPPKALSVIPPTSAASRPAPNR